MEPSADHLRTPTPRVKGEQAGKGYMTLGDICAIPDDTHPPIISRGLMPHNSHILIAGESGIGKSLLRLELSLHIAMGWDWQGFKIPRARSVAIFQFENSEATEKFRIRRMVEGLGTTVQGIGDRIKYARRSERFNLCLKGDRKRLMDRVKALRCEVIFYDCLSNLHCANENDNVKMREVLDILTDINAELGTACILIHHFGKPGAEGFTPNAYRIRGASSIMDWAYTVMTFTRQPHESKELRKIEFPKVRDGRQPKPFLVERDPETFLCHFYDEESLVSPALVRTVLEELGGLSETQRELIKAIMSKAECSDRTAASAIRRAVEFKTIFETRDGRTKGYRTSMMGDLK